MWLDLLSILKFRCLIINGWPGRNVYFDFSPSFSKSVHFSGPPFIVVCNLSGALKRVDFVIDAVQNLFFFAGTLYLKYFC